MYGSPGLVAFAIVAGAAVATGCFEPYQIKLCTGKNPTTLADEEWYCAPFEECSDPPIYCGEDPNKLACKDAAPFASCPHTSVQLHDGEGSCVPDGSSLLCTKCNQELAGCAYPGWTSMTSGVFAALKSVLALSPSEVYAVGEGGTFLYYDGLGWRRDLAQPPTTNTLVGIAGTSSNNLHAISSEAVYRFDGTSWSELSDPMLSSVRRAAIAMAGQQIFIVNLDGLIEHFNGSQWSTSMAPEPLYGVWADESEALVVGRNSLIQHYTPQSGWTTSKPAMAGAGDLLAVWRANGVAHVTGTPSRMPAGPTRILRGPDWTQNVLPPNLVSAIDLVAIYGADNHWFAIGQQGAFIWTDGARWFQLALGGSFSAISGASSSSVYAVGDAGTIRRYTGKPPP